MIKIVVSNVQIDYGEPEQRIVEQNADSDNRLFFIYKGKFEVEIIQYGTQDGKPEFLRTLKEGDYFGEVSIIFGCKRTATVRVKDYGMYGTLDG